MAEVLKWAHMNVISTSNPEKSLHTPHTCKVPVKFKIMLTQGKRKSALESKCIHLKNTMFQLNMKEYPITEKIPKDNKCSNRTVPSSYCYLFSLVSSLYQDIIQL